MNIAEQIQKLKEDKAKAKSQKLKDAIDKKIAVLRGHKDLLK